MSKNRQGKILALGSVNADFQVRVERRPEISETLAASDFVRLSGGKSANVAFLARMLGAQASLLAHVGDDELAEQALGPLRDIGVDLSGVASIAQMDTGVSMITVPPDGKKGIVLAANANEAWNESDFDAVEKALRGAAAGSVLAVNCEVPAWVVQRAMQLARECGIATILDPSPADRVSDALLALADIVAPNAGEAGHLSGIEVKNPAAAEQAARRLNERGARCACVKLADGGCVLVSAEQTVHVHPVPVEVVDSTGAGDAFAGALAVAVLERQPLPDAVRFAVAASHVAVTGYGSQPAYPTREEIRAMETRLKIHPDAAHRS